MGTGETKHINPAEDFPLSFFYVVQAQGDQVSGGLRTLPSLPAPWIVSCPRPCLRATVSSASATDRRTYGLCDQRGSQDEWLTQHSTRPWDLGWTSVHRPMDLCQAMPPHGVADSQCATALLRAQLDTKPWMESVHASAWRTHDLWIQHDTTAGPSNKSCRFIRQV